MRYMGLVAMVLCALPLQAAAVDLKAGVAKGVITNSQPMTMVNGRVSEGTLKDLHARVLTLFDGDTRLVFVTYDLNCLDVATPILRDRVREELGMRPEQLILLATHTHNAPIQIVPDNFAYGRWLADTIFALIQEAIADESGPARVEFGSGHGYFVLSVGNAPADYEIQVIRVTRAGQPAALLFNHGAHPAQASVTKVEPGHPGWAMDAIELAVPGMQAMYGAAAGGNQFVRPPADHEERMRIARDAGPESVETYLTQTAKSVGQKLADATLRILDGPLVDVTGPLSSRMSVFSLPLAPPIPEAEARELAQTVPMDVGFVPYPSRDRRSNWIRMLIRYYDEGLAFPSTTTDMVCTDDTYLISREDAGLLALYDDAIHDTYPCVYTETIVAQIGPMPFVAMQGEVCGPIGMRIKDAFRADHPLFVTAYMGEHNLYIPTREMVRLDTYQAQTLRTQYASPVGWDPSVEDVMVQGVVQMIQQSLDDNTPKGPGKE